MINGKTVVAPQGRLSNRISHFNFTTCLLLKAGQSNGGLPRFYHFQGMAKSPFPYSFVAATSCIAVPYGPANVLYFANFSLASCSVLVNRASAISGNCFLSAE